MTSVASWWLLQVALAAALVPGPVRSAEGAENGNTVTGSRAATPTRAAPGTLVISTDLSTRMNPMGLVLALGAGYRLTYGSDDAGGITSSSLQVGAGAAISPAFVQAGPQVDWAPCLPLQLHVQYDLYRFFGARGSLLSFPSSHAAFGPDQLDALSGREEAAFGHRVLFRPVLRVKVRRLIVRNQTDLAYYRFGGRGPYYYEREFDTLLRNGDGLVSDRLAFLVQVWQGRGETGLLLGPAYEVTHAFAASLTRQRAGLQAVFQPEAQLGPFRRLRVYGLAGVNLQDRNHAGEPFVALGVGNTF